MRAADTISVATSAACVRTRGGVGTRRAAFTLVELLVTMVIIAILAALSLAGLAGVRQRAKADKTRNTIRKIDAVIRPMYDSYRNRRVLDLPPPADPQTARAVAAMQLLEAKRWLVAFEMPDRWSDVPRAADVRRGAKGPKAVPDGFRTAAVRSYAAATAGYTTDEYRKTYGGAECLYLILERSGFDPDALEFFRPDEIGDLDQDGRPEFLDGWGRPIAFLRWAPGFVSDGPLVTSNPRRYSPIQVADPVNAHDPFDPMRIDATAYALVPLIYSSGPDGATAASEDDELGYGLADFERSSANPPGWTDRTRNLLQLIPSSVVAGTDLVGAPVSDEALDNITNHDLLKK
jgi:prepilin-type N-terminal cleavage/methylation domain-containing protein